MWNRCCRYCPHSKKYLSNSYKIKEGRSTAKAFNMKYDGRIFIGLYNNGLESIGVEPYPEGTSALIDNFQGTLMSVPSSASNHQLPATKVFMSFISSHHLLKPTMTNLPT
jgi:hypothetical protein